MEFPTPLLSGRLLRRYKRFLADIRLDDGREVVAHTANTGAMTGCVDPGMRVWVSESDNPKRKTRFSWELSENQAGILIGIHTHLANRLVAEAIDQGLIEGLAGYQVCAREVPLGERNRADLRLCGEGLADCLVEVKNLTLAEGDLGRFPDAPSARGLKQLQVMTRLAAEGKPLAVVYCVQRGDVECVAPADAIDPAYGEALRQAVAAGVEVYALRIRVTPEALVPECTLPVTL